VECIEAAGRNPAGASRDGGMYVRGDGGWSAGLHPMDRFVKNTYEILSPLNEITSRVAMSGHEALSRDRKVRQSVFGEGGSMVKVIVNGSSQDYRTPLRGLDVVLPPNGFLIESATFVAFCASQWNGLAYDGPTCFTIRSLDGKAIEQSGSVRVYHAFGEGRIKLGGKERRVEKEATISLP